MAGGKQGEEFGLGSADMKSAKGVINTSIIENDNGDPRPRVFRSIRSFPLNKATRHQINDGLGLTFMNNMTTRLWFGVRDSAETHFLELARDLQHWVEEP